VLAYPNFISISGGSSGRNHLHARWPLPTTYSRKICHLLWNNWVLPSITINHVSGLLRFRYGSPQGTQKASSTKLRHCAKSLSQIFFSADHHTSQHHFWTYGQVRLALRQNAKPVRHWVNSKKNPQPTSDLNLGSCIYEHLKPQAHLNLWQTVALLFLNKKTWWGPHWTRTIGTNPTGALILIKLNPLRDICSQFTNCWLRNEKVNVKNEKLQSRSFKKLYGIMWKLRIFINPF
jgi:hypothetical protein